MTSRFLLLLFIASRLLAVEPGASPSPEFDRAVREASDAFEAKDFAKAEAKLQTAETITPNSITVANFRAAIMVEQKKYDEADKAFDAILARDPKFFPARFNKPEIRFVQGQYPEALEGFEGLLSEDPKNEFLQFKVVLCRLMAKKDDDAKKLLDSMKFPSDTPSIYFAKAAWEFSHGNPGEAKGWLHSAQAVFLPESLKLLERSFTDLGWMKAGEKF